jgi:hypothetical protein
MDERHFVDDWEQEFDDDIGEFMRGRCLHCGQVQTRKITEADELYIPEDWSL